MEPFVYEPDGPTCAARMIGYVAGLLEPSHEESKLEEVERFERDVKPAAAVPLRRHHRDRAHAGRDPRRASRCPTGARARASRPRRWRPSGSTRAPRFTDEQNLDQLRQSLDARHRALPRAAASSTPFGLFAGTYREQQARGAALGLNPLVASYGPALLDRAILDALGRGDRPLLRRDDRAATCPASARPT